MKKLIYTLIIATLVYGGYMFGKPHLTCHFIKKQMQGLADHADKKSDREIVSELIAFAGERDLRLTRKEIKVTRHDGRTSISVKYSQVVEVPGITRNYSFDLRVIS